MVDKYRPWCYLNIRKVVSTQNKGVLIRKTSGERKEGLMGLNTELGERKLTILKAIIQNYLETGRACWFPNTFQIHGFEFEFCDDTQRDG